MKIIFIRKYEKSKKCFIWQIYCYIVTEQSIPQNIFLTFSMFCSHQQYVDVFAVLNFKIPLLLPRTHALRGAI